ncbi:Protocadherin Fat 4 [Mactra antiquata]
MPDHSICNADFEAGLPNKDINDYDKEDPTTGTTDKAYLHKGPEGLINCCGILDRYEFEIDKGNLQVFFQIWRPTTGGYKLISHILKTCPGADRCEIVASGNQKITVLAGDLWGWYTPGDEDLEYDDGNNHNYLYMTLTSPVVDTTVSPWDAGSGAVPIAGRIYGINVQLNANNPPTFSLPGNPTIISIPESTVVTNIVYSAVAASDSDVSDDPILSITMTANTYFKYNNITAKTGNVEVQSDIGSAPPQVDLSFTVTDQCHQTDTATLRINIDNVPAVIVGLPANKLISEHTASVVDLIVFNVTDYNDNIECEVESVTPSNANTSKDSFQIIKISNEKFNLTTSSAAKFFYNTATKHDLVVKCNDGDADSRSTFTVKLEKNKAPVMANLPSSITISEDVTIEQRLITINLTDSDQAITDTTITLGTGSSPASYISNFRVRKINGTNDYGIFTTGNANFTYNIAREYTLQLIAHDGRDSTIEYFTVNLIANFPPWINNLPANVILPSTSSISHLIFNVGGVDNETNQIFYNCTCSPTCEPFTCLQDGRILLNQDLSTTTIVGYNIYVQVRDAKNNGENRTLTITVTGINDRPEMVTLNTSVNIPEETAVNTFVANATCNDNDATDTITYSMTCLPTWGAPFVQINSTDGVIKTLSVINYENIPVTTGARKFTCTAKCSDGRASSTATLDITILDINEAPKFSQSTYNAVLDEGPAGTKLYTKSFNLTDDDIGDNATYSLDCGTNTGLFRVNEVTGIIEFGVDYDVDTGAPLSLTCILKATDRGGLNASVTIPITVRNVNDNKPKFSRSVYTFSVWKQAVSGTPIDIVTATDGDITPYGAPLTYTLNQTGLGCLCFSISSSGQLTTADSLTGINASSVTFTVYAADSGQNSTATIIIVFRENVTPAPTERFWTFIDDPRNIAWLIAFLVILAVICGVIAYILITAKSTPGGLRCQCCRIRRSFTPERSERKRGQRSPPPLRRTRHFPQIKPF